MKSRQPDYYFDTVAHLLYSYASACNYWVALRFQSAAGIHNTWNDLAEDCSLYQALIVAQSKEVLQADIGIHGQQISQAADNEAFQT